MTVGGPGASLQGVLVGSPIAHDQQPLDLEADLMGAGPSSPALCVPHLHAMECHTALQRTCCLLGECRVLMAAMQA